MSYQYDQELNLQKDMLLAVDDGRTHIQNLLFPECKELDGLTHYAPYEEWQLPSGKFIDIFMPFFNPYDEECPSILCASAVVELKRGTLEMDHVEQVLNYKREIDQDTDYGGFNPVIPILIGYDDSKLNDRYNCIMDELGVCVMLYDILPHKGLTLRMGDYGDTPSMRVYEMLQKAKNENPTA